tara:strand:- start:1232 stop:1978 length:747 start_codon:yes stop_codon:yes gene_type:complete
MAIKSNSSEQEVSGGGIKLYSGLSNFNVIAINPNMAELHTLGINVKTEPNYYVEFSGKEYFKLTFWVKNEDLTTRMEILMQNEHRVSQSGKNQWMNNVGQDTWADGVPTYDWWKNPDSSRKAYVGEETLINFVKAWANVAYGDEVTFDSMEKIVQGDVTELKALLGMLSVNQVRLLVGVKDGKYQNVYLKNFGRVKPQRDDLFVKALNDEYKSFNAEFNSDLVWGTFTPQLAVVTADDDSVSENDSWI